jgi:putative DNA primase/helicase
VLNASFATSNHVLDPAQPQVTATLFIAQAYRDTSSALMLYHHAGEFYRYQPAHAFRRYEEATVRAELLAWLCRQRTEKGGAFGVTSGRMNDILNAMRAICHLPASDRAPRWLDGREDDPFDYLPCANGLLSLSKRALVPMTPRLFTLSGVTFNYEAQAPTPMRWLRLLHELLPEDMESQDAIQEWIGYLLTSHTHFQKMLLLVGPARSGKGTIGRVIQRLLGAERVCAPTLSGLAMPFGSAVLIDKSVALIADARLSGRADSSILTERLLSISGEDPQTIQRKFLTDWNGPVPVRFMLMTNELPRIEDASGALASRFLLLVLRESFLGREDHGLFEALIPELPGILNWALDGWARLSARGRFVQPSTSALVLQEFKDLGSPIAAFLRDRTVRRGLIPKRALYDLWKVWCKDTGRDHPGTTQNFGRQLRAAVPWLNEGRPHGQSECWLGLSATDEQTQDATF